MSGVIYILTNPSFEQYVKIGYADDVDKRLQQLNRSECIPYAFRKYATYEVEARLSDLKLHAMIDRINPNLRTIDNVDGKQRVREFYAMSPETAYTILETIAELSGRTDKLHLFDMTEAEQQQQEMAQEIEEEHVERLSPFAFSKCNIPVGATITYFNRGNPNSGTECTVVDDKTVEYQGRKLSLSALATELTGGKWGVAGPRSLSVIAHCNISAQQPARTADATDDPVATVMPPPGFITVAFVPPAAISGLIRPSFVYPLPDDGTVVFKS